MTAATPSRIRQAHPRILWSDLVESTAGLGLARLDVEVTFKGPPKARHQLIVQVYPPAAGDKSAHHPYLYARPLAAACRPLDGRLSVHLTLRAARLPHGARVVAWVAPLKSTAFEFDGLECTPELETTLATARAEGGRARIELGRAVARAA